MDHIIQCSRDKLVNWVMQDFPDYPGVVTDDDLYIIADMYGFRRLREEYETELAELAQAIEMDEWDQDDQGVSALIHALEEDDQRGGTEPAAEYDLSNLFKLVQKSEKQIKKFNSTEYRYEVEIAPLPAAFTPEETMRVMPQVLQNIFEICTDEFNPYDRVIISLETKDFHPVYLSMRKFLDFNIETLMQKIELLNSQKKLSLDDSFQIRIFRTLIPSGGRRSPKHVHVSVDRKRWARSIVSVHVNDNLCLPAALYLGEFRLIHNVSRNGSHYNEYCNLIRKDRSKKLAKLAAKVCTDCGLRVGKKMDLDDIAVLQRERFFHFQIIVVSTSHGNVPIAKIPEIKTKEMKEIYLLLDKDHFDLITTMKGFYRSGYYCTECNAAYNNKEQHSCLGVCRQCYRSKTVCLPGEKVLCQECGRRFENQTCFDIHNTVRKNGSSYCKQLFVCKHCGVFVSLRNRKQDNPHICGEMFCHTCYTFVPQDTHKCYLEPLPYEPFNEEPAYIFFDYETWNDPDAGHVPVMAIAQYPDGTEFRFPADGEPIDDSVGERFARWLFSDAHKGATIIAHNFRGYDGHFLLKHMLDNNMKGLKVVKRGNQLLEIQYKSLHLRSRDTLNFIAQRLADIPRTVGLPESDHKGDFPHLLTNPDVWNRSDIPFPQLDDFMWQTKPKKERESFKKWHAETKIQSGGQYNFRQEMARYCSMDVTVLRKAALKFREDFIKVTKIDPFASVTIAAACQKYFRTFHLKKEEIAIISAHGYNANRTTSIQALQWLEWENQREHGAIQHGRNAKEKRIGRYFVDGFNPDTNIVYEYNGCVFHGHPECTNEEDTVPFGNKKMKEVYEEWQERVAYLESLGMTVRVKWSCVWLQEREDTRIRQFCLNMNLREPLKPHDAFKGGRTNAFRLYSVAEINEKIVHKDIVSLYPSVNKQEPYPIGHPQRIVSGFGDMKSYFGFVYCKILPPSRLHFPVLPLTINGKLIFTLCYTCASEKHQGFCEHSDAQRALEGVFVTPELHHALDRGYTILEVYEVWHWKERRVGLFAEYVNHFMKEKIEAGGWPHDCVTEEQKRSYVDNVFEREQIKLDFDKVENNPGRKAVAKLMLNSFWGKFGQRDNLTQTSFVHDPKKFFQLLRSEAIEIHDLFAVSPECMMVTTSRKEDYNEGGNAVNIAIAAFTTSHARLRLLKPMEILGQRVCYADTDSLIYTVRPGEWDIPEGNMLGDWDNQLKPGEYITQFVACAPKVYSYHTNTGKTELKVKGLTQNAFTENILDRNLQSTNKALDFDQLMRLVEGAEEQMEVNYPHFIKKNGKTQQIDTVQLTKTLKKVYDKRIVLPDFNTMPYGTKKN